MHYFFRLPPAISQRGLGSKPNSIDDPPCMWTFCTLNHTKGIKRPLAVGAEVWFNKTNSVENKEQSGRPRTFSEREKRWIVRQVHSNPRTSAIKLTLKCKSSFRKSVNPETVGNVLRKHKYHSSVPRRKPYISKANLKARLAFAKMYVKQPTEFWENVIFVDESKYNIFGSDGKQKVWRTPNTVLHIKNLQPTVKYGDGNQLVWGCMASSSVGNLDL
ncbi:Transposable element Tc1 transposase [Araneus ventricosus]|uniref:Transposable element Tc1 transposase n=1 Tax=Araneus ventricosus TaxID=182803 RepID=A0A4Y2L845_ARAVE|nr:Transposable element Tc1 transposase [Araneus ventricosus]